MKGEARKHRQALVGVLLLATSLVAQCLPQFVSGDIGKVRARVKSAIGVDKKQSISIITIEVSNDTELWVEPTIFELTFAAKTSTKSKPVRHVRCSDSPWGRAGRACAPHATETYQIQVDAEKDIAARAIVGIGAASFVDRESAWRSTAPIVLSRPKKVRVRGDVGTLDATEFVVENKSPHAVDFAILATLESPWDGPAVYRLSVPPSSESTWRIVNTSRSDVESGAVGSYDGAHITRAKLIDWSVRLTDDAEGADAELRSAWDSWERWPSNAIAVSGRYEHSRSQTDADDGVAMTYTGTFRIDDQGIISVTTDRDTIASFRDEIRGRIREAFSYLRRPDYDTMRKGIKLRRGDADAVVVTGRGWIEQAYDVTYVTLRDGAISNTKPAEAAGEMRVEFETARDGGLWRIIGFREYASSGDDRPHRIGRLSYATERGLPVPSRYEVESRVFGSSDRSADVLTLRDIEWIGPKTAPATQTTANDDPLRARVKAAWDGPYRYPDRTVKLSGRFEMGGRLTDGVWQGMNRVTGTFVLEGFRGMLQVDLDRWKSATFAIDGRLPKDRIEALEFALEDRFRMWAFRDFGGRETFAKSFAGATFSEADKSNGWIDTRNGPCKRLRILDGRIVEIDGLKTPTSDSSQRSIEYQALDDGIVVGRRIRTGGETLSAEFTKLDATWTLPRFMRFEAVFGADWGPEELTLSSMRIE